MSNYEVKHQKNVYYIDIDTQAFEGYIETTILPLQPITTIDYVVTELDIRKVLVATENDFIDSEFQLNGINLKIKMNNQESEFRIRIIYKLTVDNKSISFYDHNGHRECIAQNYSSQSSGIFPNIVCDSGYAIDLFYKLPNSYTIVSPGRLIGSVEQKEFSITQYSAPYVLSGNINFAVGTYDSIEMVSGDDSKVFYVPTQREKTKFNYMECLKQVLQDAVNCYRCIESFICGDYPSISILFTKVPIFLVNGLNTGFIPISTLPIPGSIDLNFEFKRKIAKIMCVQPYIKINGADYLRAGCEGYLYDNCIKYFFGNNEMLFRYRKNIDFVVRNDVREKCLDDSTRTEASKDSKFFRTKSKLIFHLLETHLSRAFMQKILFSIKDKLILKTDIFIKLIRDICGKDMTSFFRTYACKPGLVIFNCSFQIDQKKNKVILSIKQRPTSFIENANKKFIGNLCVRAYEIEGVFEHSYGLSKNEIVFLYHTRTKKTKKKENESLMPLLWLRIDPKQEFLCGIELNQPDFMFQETLLHDKSVFGQYDAIRALEKRPSEDGCAIMERVLLDNSYFYRIRIEIAYALGQITMPDYDGYQKLIQFFVKKFCFPGSTMIKPNDFSNFTLYFLQTGLLGAIANSSPFITKMLEKEIVSRDVIIAFLNSVIRYNDNEGNEYNDCGYLSRAIEKISYQICTQLRGGGIRMNEKFKKVLRSSVELIESYRKYDLISPSNCNCITVACIYTLTKLYCYGLVKIDTDILIQYSKKENFISVRLAALEALILQQNDFFMEYVFYTIKTGEYRVVMHILHIFKNILMSTIFNKDLGEINEELNLKFGEEDLFEVEKERYQHKSVSGIVDFFRKHIDKFKNLSNSCQNVVLSEIIEEILCLLEGKGRICKEDEQVFVHEFSEEEEIKEEIFIMEEEEEEEIKLPQNTIVRFKKEYFIPEIKSVEEQEIKVILKLPKDFIQTDNFVVVYESAKNSKIDYIFEEFAIRNSTELIDRFIVENRSESDFFCATPIRLKDIINKKDKTIEDLYNAYFAMIYVLTFETFNSRLYLQCKTAISNLEFLELNFLDQVKVVLLDVEKKNNMLNFIDGLMSMVESSVFIEEVEYKKHKFYKYVDIVRSPVCLSQIVNRLENGYYLNYNAVVVDLHRIFTNCFLFNQQNSQIYSDALYCLDKIKEYTGSENGNEVFYNPETECVDNSLILTILQEISIKDGRWTKLTNKAEKNEYVTVGHLKENISMVYNDVIKTSSSGSKIIREYKNAIRLVWKKLGGLYGENVYRILNSTKL